MTSNKFRQARLPLAITCVTVLTASVHAAPPAFQDTRALGMGGTGVAAARPSGAAFHNPSLLAAKHSGWYDGFNLTMPSVNARFADDEDTIDQVDDVQDTINDLNSTLSGFTIGSTQQEVDQAQAEADLLADQLEELDGDAVRFDIGAGTLFAAPNSTLGVSLHVTAQGRGTVEGAIDNDQDDTESDIPFLRDIADAASAAEVEQERNQFDEDNDGQIEDDFDSEGRVLAGAIGEAGISFAGTLDVQGQPIHLGVTPKIQNVRTFDFVANVDNFDEDEFDGDEFETEETYFNFDMGASATLGDADQWRVGAVVKNLIPRTLETTENNGSEQAGVFGQEEMRIDPMVTVGIAHQSGWHTLTADIDLTQNKGMGQMADRQFLSLGGEINLLDWIQVRGGLRHNIEGDTGGDGVEETTQFTGGLALSPWALRAEIGALVGNDEIGGSAELGLAF